MAEGGSRIGVSRHNLYTWLKRYNQPASEGAECQGDQVVGWSMHSRIDSELAINALLMAVSRGKPKTPLIVHSDRGVNTAAMIGKIS